MVIDVTSSEGPFKAERLWMLRWFLLQARQRGVSPSPSAAQVQALRKINNKQKSQQNVF